MKNRKQKQRRSLHTLDKQRLVLKMAIFEVRKKKVLQSCDNPVCRHWGLDWCLDFTRLRFLCEEEEARGQLQKVLLQLPARISYWWEASLLASLLVGSWGTSGEWGWMALSWPNLVFFSFVFGTGLFNFVFCSISLGYYFIF